MFLFIFYGIFVLLLCVHDELDNNANKLWKCKNKIELKFFLVDDSGGLIFKSSLILKRWKRKVTDAGGEVWRAHPVLHSDSHHTRLWAELCKTL